MADELVRYDFEQAWSEGGTAAGLDLVARDSGHWVRYQDYAALEASCAAMKSALKSISGNHDLCNYEDWCSCASCTARAALTQANGEGGRDGG